MNYGRSASRGSRPAVVLAESLRAVVYTTAGRLCGSEDCFDVVDGAPV